MPIKRAHVLMLVAASMFWVLIGPASMTAAAAGPESGTPGSSATTPGFDNENGDPRHGCHHGEPGDASTSVCCGNSHLDPGSNDGTQPRRVPARNPTSPKAQPRPATVTAPEDKTTPPATSPPPASAPPGTPVGEQPPVIAPPALTIPAPSEVTTGARGGPDTTYALALAAVLVAATIAVATLIRIRRSD